MATSVNMDRKAQLQYETRMFYGLAALVFSAVIIFMCLAPVPKGDSCKDVSIVWLITGFTRDLSVTLKKSWICVAEYQKDNSLYTMGVFCSLYISLQSFAIPGPIVLSVLGGALYGFFGGQLIIACCATFGASVCFCLSQFFGRGILHFYKLDSKVEGFEKEVHENKGRLWLFILLSRLTPVPNVLINMASPLVGVPLTSFSMGTFFGLIPLNILHVTTGMALVTLVSDPSKFRDTLEQNKIIGYAIFSVGSLLCVALFLKRRLDRSKKKE